MSIKSEEDIRGLSQELLSNLGALSHGSPSIGGMPSVYNPLSPLSHWTSFGALGSLRGNAYRERLDEETANYHHPRAKHYDDKIEKQRLEHILFAGSNDDGPLDRTKERMRRKLRSKKMNTVDELLSSLPPSPQKSPKMSPKNRPQSVSKKPPKKKKDRRGGGSAKRRAKKNKRARPKSQKSPDLKKSTDSVSESVSVSPHSELMDAAPKELDELSLNKTAAAPTAPTQSTDSSMDCDIDDGDHEDSSAKDDPQGLSVERESKELLLATVQRQSEEIQMLRESVSALIATVSRLEDAGRAASEEAASLRQRVRVLECGGPHEALRRWLTDEVKLGQYAHVLIDHGFEDLVAAQTLTMDVLDAVEGIDKIGHKTRIMHFVERLKAGGDSETHEF